MRHARRGLHPHRARQGPDPSTGALWRHAVPNALIPVADHPRPAVPVPAGRARSSSRMCSPCPGVGRLVFQAIAQRDLDHRPIVVVTLSWPRPSSPSASSIDLAYVRVSRSPSCERRTLMGNSSANTAIAAEPGFLQKMLASRNLMIGLVITLILVAMAVVSFVWTPYSATAMNFKDKLQGPSFSHWFGTDQFRPRRTVDDHGRRAQLDRRVDGRRRSSARASAFRSARLPPREAAGSTDCRHAHERSDHSPFRRC
jgi:hypothetical protein